jgi:hypothetical protein
MCLRHRGAAVRRLLDAFEHGLVGVRREIPEGDLPQHEVPELLIGIRREHPPHQLLELGGAWLVGVAHAYRSLQSWRTHLLARWTHVP